MSAPASTLPRLLITLGDVAGIGPEIIARGWPDLLPLCRPVVVGDPGWLRCQVTGAADLMVENPTFARAVWEIYLGRNNLGEPIKAALASRL